MNIEARLEEVRAEYLRRMTRGDGHLLHEVETYASSCNGKMLRPRMLLLSAATLGEEHFLSSRTLLLAVCVEMLHNASLLHDDVIDHADSRRGRPSVNAHWGKSVAVLVGDYLLAQTMQLLDEVGDNDATRQVNQTVLSMVEAELLAQETLNQSSNQTIKQYLSIIDGKTANLFALAASLGNPQYKNFGLHYGRLFQMRDDIADNEAPEFVEELIHQETQEINNMKYKLSI